MNRRIGIVRSLSLATLAGVVLLSSGCIKGPQYVRPRASVPESFKETPPQGWKEAQPSDGILRGHWWEIFGDSTLNEYEEQVSISNQNVLQVEAQYREAKAVTRIARANLFPVVTAAPSATGGQASNRFTGLGSNVPTSQYVLPVDASYTADVWGSLHRSVTAASNTAQAMAAQLENARLLYSAELAADYFQLHGIDADAALLQRTLESYQEYLTLTRNRYAGGIASDSDVAQAETQLYTTQAQLTDLQVQRSQLEHAIAILIGKPPAEFSIPPALIQVPPPRIPVGLPSALLERRPDIAQAERQAAAANEQIGIAQAAFYPTLSFSAAAGVESVSLLNWITWPSRFWTVGPQLAQILFDAGKRRATLAEYQANYRQTVLAAFQQVEDNLAALRTLEVEGAVLDRAVSSAQRSLAVSTAQYKAGTASYLQVITAQTIALQDERSAVDVRTRRMSASVLLIEALGGGWNASGLPNTADILAQK
jgi:NodT family efflux transporter outer membrane factor (OMF) lipoprotein